MTRAAETHSSQRVRVQSVYRRRFASTVSPFCCRSNDTAVVWLPGTGRWYAGRSSMAAEDVSRHGETAEAALAASRDLLTSVTGYPQGLKGDEIALDSATKASISRSCTDEAASGRRPAHLGRAGAGSEWPVLSGVLPFGTLQDRPENNRRH